MNSFRLLLTVAVLAIAITAVFISTVPVLAALIAIPALGEVPSVTAWIGIGVVTLGVLLAMGAVGRSYGARSEAS